MDAKLIEELRQKYSKNPPEGMKSNLSVYYSVLQRFICFQHSP